MKFNDKIAQRIIAIGITLSAFALIFTLFMGTVGSATAATPTNFNFPDKLSDKDMSNLATASGGKYMMQFQTLNDKSTATHHYYVLVWDTETGKSKMYYGTSEQRSIGAAPSGYNLPSNPLH